MTTGPVFLYRPYLREGWIQSAVGVTTGPDGPVVTVPYTLLSNGNSATAAPLQATFAVRGPADADSVGWQDVRDHEPRAGTHDAEWNYFPHATFLAADLPWRHSPLPASAADASVTPWLALLVLSAAEFEELSAQPPGALVGCVKLLADGVWPPQLALEQSAHVELEKGPNAADVEEARSKSPASVRSRILSMRKLAAKTKYRAFLVPTFRVAAERLRGESSHASHLELFAPTAGQTIPYYVEWSFETGDDGDFESLVRRIESRRLTGLGFVSRDVSDPGFGVSGVAWTDASGALRTDLAFEGALASLDFTPTPWGRDAGRDEPFHDDLARLLEEEEQKTSDDEDPIVGPGTFGHVYVPKGSVRVDSPSWASELNLDPRHRAAAAVGVEVIRKNQDAYLEGAERQLGSRDAGRAFEAAQMGRAISSAAYERLEATPAITFVVTAAALLGRVFGADGKTLDSALAASRLPPSMLSGAFVRALRRSLSVGGSGAVEAALSAVNNGTLAGAGPHPRAGGLTFDAAISVILEKESVDPRTDPGPLLEQCQELQRPHSTEALDCQRLLGRDWGDPPDPRPARGADMSLVTATPARPHRLAELMSRARKAWITDLGRQASLDVRRRLVRLCEGWLDPTPSKPRPPFDFEAAAATIRDQARPDRSIPERVASRVTVLGRIPARKDPLGPLLRAPIFDFAMSEALAEFDKHALLPGVDAIPQNSVGLLRANRRFVESFMVGLNHEFGRELEWHEYPTDLRGTYFRQFWNVDEVDPAASVLAQRIALARAEFPKVPGESDADYEARILVLVRASFVEDRYDIEPLHQWGEIPLGNHDTTARDGQLVLVVRSMLFRRYPGTRVYAARGDIGEGSASAVETEQPIFAGDIPTDIRYFGFALRREQIQSEPWYFVFEEPSFRTRFGADLPRGADAAFQSWSDLSWSDFAATAGQYVAAPIAQPIVPGGIEWKRGAAHVAAATLQRPVRLSIRATRLVPH